MAVPRAVTRVIAKQVDRTTTHQAYMDRKADFGTMVHRVIELYGEDDTPIEQVASDYGILVADALARYRMMLATDPLMSTATGIRHELRLTVANLSGQIDILCEIVGEDGYTHVAIIDIKTGDDDITQAYQLSLYGYLYYRKHGVLPRLYRLGLEPGKETTMTGVTYIPMANVRDIINGNKEARK